MRKDSELKNIHNYLRFSDRITTAGQPDESELKTVARAGFEVVVNLGLTDTHYALPDEKGLVESLGLAYVHLPVSWENPEFEKLLAFFQTMSHFQDRRLFIHCAANKRVSVFMALYQTIKLGLLFDECIKTIHQIWVPNEIWSDFLYRSLQEAYPAEDHSTHKTQSTLG